MDILDDRRSFYMGSIRCSVDLSAQIGKTRLNELSLMTVYVLGTLRFSERVNDREEGSEMTKCVLSIGQGEFCY